MRKVLPFLLLAGLVAPQALAGFAVEQKVVYGGKAGKSEAKLSWTVAEREFRVDVMRGADVRNFVFNGRIFYVCGKLDKKQLDLIQKLDVQDKDLLARLEKGTCQELATDFGARFFLSPFDAIGSVDVAGGYATSMTLDEAEIELTGDVTKVQKTKCVGFSRSYTIGDRKRKKLEQSLEETACNATTIKWRTALARELSMALMRQPGGKQASKILTGDLKKMAGLSLKVSGKVSGMGGDGTDIARTFEVTTSSVKTKTPAAKEIGLPEGFEIIDPKSLASLARKGPAAASKSQESEAATVLKYLLLGGSPGAGLLKSLSSGGGKETEK